MPTASRPLYRRRGFIIAAVAIAVPIMAFGWYFFSPLLFDKEVIEDFPRAALVQIPDELTAEQVEAEMLRAEDAAVTAADDMPVGGPVALFTGSLMDADSFHKGSGGATIYELEDGSRILRLEELDVTNGPDLHVVLSPVADPQERSDVMSGGYIDLGSLKGNLGDQNYEIPAEFVIGSEISVVVYCQPFHVIFSTATLSAV